MNTCQDFITYSALSKVPDSKVEYMISVQHRLAIIIIMICMLQWKKIINSVISFNSIKGWDVLDSHIYKLPPSSGKRGYKNSRGQSRIRSKQPGAPVVVILWNQRESYLLPNQPAPRRILKLGVPKRKQTRKECELTAFQKWRLPFRMRLGIAQTACGRPHTPCLKNYSILHR